MAEILFGKLKLITSEKLIQEKIVQSLLERINKNIKVFTDSVELFTRNELKTALLTSPAYISTLYGELQAEFGLINPEASISPVIAKWLESVKCIPISPPKILGRDKLTAIFRVRAIQANYDDVLSLDVASYISPRSKQDIPWLAWLLGSPTSYDSILDWRIDYGNFPRARSKKAHMIKSDAGWTIATHSHLLGQNFVPKVVAMIRPLIKQKLEQSTHLLIG